MKALLSIALWALMTLPSFAETSTGNCAAARDPERCETQRAALKACADLRGPEKRACLDAALPPVDCSKASNPERCEKAQKAKEACKTKSGKELKKCLRDESPKKQRHKRKATAQKN